ncbi:MAG: WecB/TagA/CpsF family glycosyltransferase [Chloroflexi bacterium]|nr:WecB/TagA/CpsF family glycosyltransferase [Chloroflexota bacterium]MCL5026625.1 WecB/TagA/CpsF family glycosyltransferase [Chloroflexota bacterium]
MLGSKVHDVTYEEALEAISYFIRSGKPHQIVTSNPEFVMLAREDVEFDNIINEASLVIPDGVGLVWASSVLGYPIRQQVTGTDLVHRMMEMAVKEGYRVFLLGAAEGIAQLAAKHLQEMYPGLQIAGTYSGFPYPRYDDATVSIIEAAGRVDIMLVAYGAPAQEKWIARNQARLGIPVAIGVGGVFDFISGRVRRAPPWVRRFGLEWLYRLIRQPWRWRRQLALPRFALAVLALRLGRG